MNHQEDYRSQPLRKRYEKQAARYGQPTQAQHERALQTVRLVSLLFKYVAPAEYADIKRQHQRPVSTYIPAIHGTLEELQAYGHFLALLSALKRALARLPFLRSRSDR